MLGARIELHAKRARCGIVPARSAGVSVGAEPGKVRNLVIVQIFTEWELATLKNWISTHETDGLAKELNEVVILCGQIPVEPANRVVLTISVVIATLSPGELVAAEQHRRAGRKEQRTRVVLHELQPEREHAGVGRFALGAAVP